MSEPGRGNRKNRTIGASPCFLIPRHMIFRCHKAQNELKYCFEPRWGCWHFPSSHRLAVLMKEHTSLRNWNEIEQSVCSEFDLAGGSWQGSTSSSRTCEFKQCCLLLLYTDPVKLLPGWTRTFEAYLHILTGKSVRKWHAALPLPPLLNFRRFPSPKSRMTS